jgi:hypothetical protein
MAPVLAGSAFQTRLAGLQTPDRALFNLKCFLAVQGYFVVLNRGRNVVFLPASDQFWVTPPAAVRMSGEGRPFRVFWPLDLTGPPLEGGGALYGFSRPGSARVAAAVVVAGALDSGSPGCGDAELRLRSAAACLLLQPGEQLCVLGEWTADPPADSVEGRRQRQDPAGAPTPRTTRARQRQQQRHKEGGKCDWSAANGKEGQQQQQQQRQRRQGGEGACSGVWVTAIGAAPHSRTRRPMACPHAPGAPLAGTAVPVPQLTVRWPGQDGCGADVDVFLYAVPQIGRSHAPVLAAEAAAAEAAAAEAAAVGAAAVGAAADGKPTGVCASGRPAKAAAPGSGWMGDGPGEHRGPSLAACHWP